MASVAATLDISWTSIFVGQHRVCWRIVPSLVYDCTTIVYCTGSGDPCSASIPITVDNESCDEVTYEGYVQAVCEPEDSTDGRIPFSITFVPAPECASYRVACIGAPIADFVFNGPPGTEGGYGYDVVGPPPAITISLVGSGAVATTTVDDTIIISTPGDGLYTDGTYTNVPFFTITGIGTGGQATVVVSGGNVTSVVTTLYGLDYYFGDEFTFTNTDIGGTGSTFLGTFGPDYSRIALPTLVTPGDGYDLTSIVTVDPPLGSGLTAVVGIILDFCPDQSLGTSCDDSTSSEITGMSVDSSAIECIKVLPVINPDYSFTPDGCCFDCRSITFTSLSVDPITLYYTDCTTKLITSVVMNLSDELTVCVVNNSWYWDTTFSINVLDNGDCS